MEFNLGELIWRKRKTLLVFGVFFFLGVLFLFFYFNWLRETRESERIIQTNEAYLSSVTKNDPSLLQQLFLEDMQNGRNDDYTKSTGYFVTHRFFDNGGDIYEVYDYINSHPELAFLKEAEEIYPEMFKRIREHTLSPNSSGMSTHAYLAYLEILDKYGYAGVANRGTLANGYAKLAWLAWKQPEAFPRIKGVRMEWYQARINKAVLYANKVQPDIMKVLDGTFDATTVPERDILVGLNQYAAALRYFQALKVDFSSPRNASEIFAFSTDYARQYVPVLAPFTSLLDASTLMLVSPKSTEGIREALRPIFEHEIVGDELNRGIYYRLVVLAKTYSVARFGNSETINDDFSLYGKINMVDLAHAVPDFKNWLMKYGWVESDFTY